MQPDTIKNDPKTGRPFVGALVVDADVYVPTGTRGWQMTTDVASYKLPETRFLAGDSSWECYDLACRRFAGPCAQLVRVEPGTTRSSWRAQDSYVVFYVHAQPFLARPGALPWLELERLVIRHGPILIRHYDAASLAQNDDYWDGSLVIGACSTYYRTLRHSPARSRARRTADATRIRKQNEENARGCAIRDIRGALEQLARSLRGDLLAHDHVDCVLDAWSASEGINGWVRRLKGTITIHAKFAEKRAYRQDAQWDKLRDCLRAGAAVLNGHHDWCSSASTEFFECELKARKPKLKARSDEDPDDTPS